MLNSSSPPPQTASIVDEKTKTNTEDAPQEDTVSKRTERAPSQEGSTDALSSPFPNFKHQELLVQPYDDELRRDVEFQERMWSTLVTGHRSRDPTLLLSTIPGYMRWGWMMDVRLTNRIRRVEPDVTWTGPRISCFVDVTPGIRVIKRRRRALWRDAINHEHRTGTRHVVIFVRYWCYHPVSSSS